MITDALVRSHPPVKLPYIKRFKNLHILSRGGALHHVYVRNALVFRRKAERGKFDQRRGNSEQEVGGMLTKAYLANIRLTYCTRNAPFIEIWKCGVKSVSEFSYFFR